MKRLLPLLVGAALFFAPRAASATPCPTSYQWKTQDVITQNLLNGINNNFSNCFVNIDYQNIDSAGIFASQIIPQSSAQATFGGTQTYSFAAPPNFGAPLTQANGGTGSTDGSINGVGLYTLGQTIAKPGAVVASGDLRLDPLNGASMGLGYDTTSMNQIVFGPTGSWATLNGTGYTVNGNLTTSGGSTSVNSPTGNLTTVNATTVNSTNVNAQTFSASNGFSLTGSSQSNGFYNDGSGNVQIYDATNNHTFGIILYHNNGRLLSNGFQTYVSAGSTVYDVPFDGNAAESAGGASYDPQYEHGQVTIPASGTTSCTSTVNFAHTFTNAPEITLTGRLGYLQTYYTQNITTNGFQACAISSSSVPSSPVTWIAVGE